MLIQMFALVIYLNNKYWEHEVDGQVPEAVFCPGGEALHSLVEHLLQQKDFWAAERLLEICFRRPNDNATILSREASRDRFAQRDCKRIWRSVEWFVNTMDGDRDEEALRARLSILQTVCEGLLRRNLSHIAIEPRECHAWSWSTAFSTMDSLAAKITNLDEDYVWPTSRRFVRQRLIQVDKSILESLTQKDLAPQNYLEEIAELRRCAEINEDLRLEHGIRQRRNFLETYMSDYEEIEVDSAPERQQDSPTKLHMRVSEMQHKLEESVASYKELDMRFKELSMSYSLLYHA